ncbi:helix-turn-helix domain-containing protein [Mycobacterium sp. URHB0021]
MPDTVTLYRIPEAQELLRIGRSTMFDLLGSGRLRSITIGRRRLIPASAIAEFVASLESETGPAA